MAYLFYLGDTLLPVTPSNLSISIKNQNKTLNLINDSEINILKQAGLTEISFSALLPNANYPFAVYNDGFQNANFYLDKLEELKVNQVPFQFIVTRELPSQTALFSTNIKVSIESYDITEDVKNGFDIIVKISLKQYQDYGTKVCTVETDTSSAETNISVEEVRETTTSPTPVTTQTYTVIKGDSLWKIAKYFYGNGNKYKDLLSANSNIISNANLIYPGQVLTIPML